MVRRRLGGRGDGVANTCGVRAPLLLAATMPAPALVLLVVGVEAVARSEEEGEIGG